MKISYQDSHGNPQYRDATNKEIAEFEAQRLAEHETAWLHKDRTIRVNLTDEQWIALSIDYPEFGVIRKQKNIPVEPNGMGGEYIYLEELYDDDRQLFEYFGNGSQCIENYQPQP